MNKIFSRIIHERIISVLLRIISNEQASFVQGGSIAENVLLVQEITIKIRKSGKSPKLETKLGMIKNYDRIEWLFLIKALRKIRFSERLIDVVYGLMENNGYSILLNGQPKIFFRYSRGIKQGDPLSLTLLILVAEVMSESLNYLMEKNDFKRFGMLKGNPKINYLAFIDDMIILCESEVRIMQIIIEILERYERVSQQKSTKKKVSYTCIIVCQEGLLQQQRQQLVF